MCNLFTELIQENSNKAVNVSNLKLMIKLCNIIQLGVTDEERNINDNHLLIQEKVILPCLNIVLKDNIF